MYYRVDLKQTEYGSGTQSVQVQVNTPTAPVTITFKYNNPDTTSPVDGNYVNKYQNQNLDLGEYTDPESSETSHLEIQGGAVKNANFSDNVLFENNITTVTINGTKSGYSTPANYVVEEKIYTDILGGALHNTNNIPDIKGDFFSNKLNITSNITADKYARNNIFVYGGAIYNTGDISSVTSNFVGNSINITANISNDNSNYSDSSIYGGAVYNSGKITAMIANFINNSITSVHNNNSFDDPYGGAIANCGTIETLSANFIDNSNNSTNGVARGGAIYNEGSMTNLSGIFSGNKVNSTGASSYGGAIYNAGDIDKITGLFINNSAESGRGGAIYVNSAKDTSIGSIEADFVNNHAATHGGALYVSTGTIGTIKGDFISNYSVEKGGAVSNYDEISLIQGDFIGNNSESGGAIYNTSEITTITGNFIGNYGSKYGGAINNRMDGRMSYINTITGDFIANYVNNNSGSAAGGAIYSNAQDDEDYDGGSEIGTLSGDFIGNYATASNNANGGALYNYGSVYMTDIAGDFIANYTKSTEAKASGGAIHNEDNSTIEGTVKGNFYQNYTEAYKDASGGAIYNDFSEITSIVGNFVENHAKSETKKALGGAINNNDQAFINEINGNFHKNYAEAVKDNAFGGAIYNDQGTKYSSGGILKLTSTFTQNYASSNKQAYGGALYTDGLIEDMKAVFTGNYTISQDGKASGGALYVDNEGVIKSAEANFTGNYTSTSGGTAAGGAVYNNSVVEKLSGNFINNKAVADTGKAYGGAIYNLVDTVCANRIVNIYDLENGELYKELGSGYYVEAPDKLYIENAIFENNSAVSNSGNAYGGAIYNNDRIFVGDKEIKIYMDDNEVEGDYQNPGGYGEEGIINVIRDKYLGGEQVDPDEFKANAERPLTELKNVSFMDNKAISESGSAKGGAIYTSGNMKITADNYQSVFSGNMANDEQEAIYVDESKYWEEPTTLTLEATNGGSFVFEDKINGKEGYILELKGDNKDNTAFYIRNDMENADVRISNTTFNAINDNVHVYDVTNFTVSGDANFAADVDLENLEMDRITSSTYGQHNGSLNVVGMNLLSDSEAPRAEIFFAETGLKDKVINGTGELPDSNYQTAYTPIYKYQVSYDNRENGGYFLFDRITAGSNSGNPSDNYNPAVLATPVGNLAAGQAAMNEAFKYVFEHADAFTQLPSMERYAKINANKYALSTDFNENMPSYADQLHNNAVWFRPYTTFETMNIKNGPKVDAITYGSLVGFDGDFKEMKNGWSRVFTGYAGYMGSSLNYSGVDTTMNGGLLGFTETFYKGNFWTAITASAGASVGESHTMYGKEDYTSLLAGVGSKTGYNFEFKDGKFIIQPIMFLSYTFVNTFDYKNAAGVSIESDPLHTIQLNPSVRFIANLKGGWQPYASVGMVWNLMNESKVTANNVKLPEMSVKPYVEYGVGVQRNWADKFTAFLQAMIRNGGRNGVALTGGFRFMLGSDDKDNDKPKVKKEIKSL